MRRTELVDEIHRLLGLIDANTTDLMPATMEVDVGNYLDRDLFDVERAEIFRNRPHFIGFSSRLKNPGDYSALEIAGVPFFVIRTDTGEVKAFLNFCRHRGAQLATDGEGCAPKGIRCPYHSWRYALDGRLLTVPYADQGFPDLDKADHGLIPLPAAEKCGMIFVTPNPDGRCDADELIGDAADDLGSWNFSERCYVETRNYDVEANWKLNLDTFGESYHFSTVHPTTFALKTFENIYTRKPYRNVQRLCHPALALKEMRHEPEDSWDVSFGLSVVYYLFPSTILFIVRGHMESFTILPGTEPGKSITRHQIYLLGPEPPESDAERKMIADLFEQVSYVLQNEDYPLVTSMQRVFPGCGAQKITFGRNEAGLHYMHQRLGRELAHHRAIQR